MRKKNNTAKKPARKTKCYDNDELQIVNPGEIHPDWVALSEAVAVIATSEAAPESLKRPVIDFLSSESGAIWGDLMVRPPVIQRILVAARGRETEVSDDAN